MIRGLKHHTRVGSIEPRSPWEGSLRVDPQAVSAERAHCPVSHIVVYNQIFLKAQGRPHHNLIPSPGRDSDSRDGAFVSACKIFTTTDAAKGCWTSS